MNPLVGLCRFLFRPKTLLFIGSAMLVFLGVQYTNYLANIHAKDTWLKPFYQQAALADRHARELNFPNFLFQVPVDGSRNGSYRGGGWRIQYCSGAGSYHNNVTGKTIDNARTCRKGTDKYYWLPVLDSQTIDQKIAAMQQSGWTVLDTNSLSDRQLLNRDIFELHENGHGFSFKRSDGTRADLSFWDRQGHDNGAGSADWCPYYVSGCSQLKNADNTHRYFMDVAVYAYKGYE